MNTGLSEEKVLQIYDNNIKLNKMLDQIANLVEGMENGFVKTEIKRILIKRELLK